jgi:hypothetical protein
MKKSILLLSLLLGACASHPTKQELAKADYGREMTQLECEAVAKREIQSVLKDSASAIYEFGKCRKRGINSIPVIGKPKEYGYYIPVMVNAKNSFGGYTGFKESRVIMRNGVVIRKSLQ